MFFPKESKPLALQAFELATDHHGYDYVRDHINEVATTAMDWYRAIFGKEALETHDGEVLRIAAALHDALEDPRDDGQPTQITYVSLAAQFGKEVATLVWLVTDEPGPSRKIRKPKSYWKLREDLRALLLKLADRKQNHYRSLRRLREDPTSDNSKAKMYVAEWPTFVAAGWHPQQHEALQRLWQSVDAQVDELTALIAESRPTVPAKVARRAAGAAGAKVA